MRTTRWSLLFLALLAPLSIGCGKDAAPVATQEELDQFAADNPDEAEVEDTAGAADAGN